jgi:hypothetical protein
MNASVLFALAALICWSQLCTKRTLFIWFRIYAALGVLFLALELWRAYA